MILGILSKLLVLQLLLMWPNIRCETEKNPSMTEWRGGYYNNQFYVMEENKTLEGVVTFFGDFETHIVWHFNNETENVFSPNVTTARIVQGENQPDIIKSTLRVMVKKHMGGIYWEAANNELGLIIEHQDLKLLVRSSAPSGIDILSDDNSLLQKDDIYFIYEDQVISINCYAKGLINYSLTWVDSTGQPVQSDETIRLGPLVNASHVFESETSVNITEQSLDFDPKRGMSAFGCKLTAPRPESLAYDVTHWFNFTVGSEPNVTLIADSSVCGKITFTCETDGISLDEIEWSVNGNDIQIGSKNLTIDLIETQLEYIECAVFTEFGTSNSYLNYTTLDNLNCSPTGDAILILLIITGIMCAIVFAVCVYFLRIFYNTSLLSPKARIYHVAAKFAKYALLNETDVM